MNRACEIPLNQLIKTKKWPKVSNYIPRRTTPRPVPWNYNKDDILFRLHEDEQIAELVLNRQSEGNFLNAANIRAMNDRLWGWRCSRTCTTAIVYANDTFEEGVGLWKPKNPLPVQANADGIEERYRIKPVVPITGAKLGEKIFCSGINPVDIAQNRADSTVIREAFANSYACSHLFASFSKYSIVLLDGLASGTGASIFLQSQYVVASEKSSLEWPETSYALIPGGGAAFLLAKMPKSKFLGKFLAMTGKRLEGADVFHSGMSRYFINSSLFADLREELKGMKQKFPLIDSILKSKMQLSSIVDFSLQEFVPFIEEAFHSNSLTEIYQNLERLSQENSSPMIRNWAEECRDELKKKSQLSLEIFLKLFDFSQSTILDSFQMEFKVVSNLLRNLELYDSISAKYVRNEPLENASMESVESFFETPKLHVPLHFHALYDFKTYKLIADRLFK